MPRIPLIASAIVVAAMIQPTFAQDDQPVWNNIEAIHGDADGLFDLLEELQDAVIAEDAETIAQHALYPLAVNDSDGNYDVADVDEFLDSFDIIFTPETQQALLDQTAGDLIVTSEGIGVGNGAIWLTNVCLDDACAETQWGILSINN